MPSDLKNLNDNVGAFPSEGETGRTQHLSPKVAISKDIPESSDKKVVFTFIQYNHSQCEIADFQKKEPKKLTQKLGEVNKIIAKQLLFSKGAGISCKPVSKSGQYECLFESLPPDVNLLEINYTDTGRIFGYLIDNVFNIIVIKRKHLK